MDSAAGDMVEGEREAAAGDEQGGSSGSGSGDAADAAAGAGATCLTLVLQRGAAAAAAAATTARGAPALPLPLARASSSSDSDADRLRAAGRRVWVRAAEALVRGGARWDALWRCPHGASQLYLLLSAFPPAPEDHAPYQVTLHVHA